jgi:hypothetical protein
MPVPMFEEPRQFIYEVVHFWASWYTGGPLVMAIALWAGLRRQLSKSAILFWAIIFLFMGFFSAWENQKQQRTRSEHDRDDYKRLAEYRQRRIDAFVDMRLNTSSIDSVVVGKAQIRRHFTPEAEQKFIEKFKAIARFQNKRRLLIFAQNDSDALDFAREVENAVIKSGRVPQRDRIAENDPMIPDGISIYDGTDPQESDGVQLLISAFDAAGFKVVTTNTPLMEKNFGHELALLIGARED